MGVAIALAFVLQRLEEEEAVACPMQFAETIATTLPRGLKRIERPDIWGRRSAVLSLDRP
jgi:hypothetical protein